MMILKLINVGPPPTKKSRLHSDESAFPNDPNALLSNISSASLAGPSSGAIQVLPPKTEADTGLNAKLGMI